jgi:phospho-N-acetylmuramoyl-pentapeptide-transferase
MLYSLFLYLATKFTIFNIVKYITFRSVMALLTAMIIGFAIFPRLINYFRNIQKGGQPIREDGPQAHLDSKKGTPTMGGLGTIISLIMATLLWSDLTNPFIWITIFVTIAFCLLGFVDDLLKITKRNSKGVSGKIKLIVQAIVSVFACWLIGIYTPEQYTNILTFPFFKNLSLDLGIIYYLLTFFVIVGASNAVNLTDGLDGLVTVPIILVTGCFAIIAYLVGNVVFASYLFLPHIPNTGELSIFCASLIGASLAFLWFNAPPAKIFMGDTGSLAFGGALGAIAAITKHEIVLAIAGGLFVIEALSVIIQVYYFKLTGGKRFFLMAPLHHHFEKKGWNETTIVVRFWIISVIFTLIALSSLKLR